MKLMRRAGERLGSTGRVVTAIVLLLVAGFAVSGVVAVRTLEHRLVDRLDGDLLDEARTARKIVEARPPDSLSAINETARPASNTALIVYDAEGRRVFSDRARTGGAPKPLPETPPARELHGRDGVLFDTQSLNDDLDYRAVAVTTSRGEVIVVAAPLDGVEETVETLSGQLLLICAVALVILALLVWAVVANANRQLDHLVDTAARIGAGDLAARVDVPQGGTGARLGHALNDMVHQLEVAFAAREASEGQVRRFAADASHELRTPLTHIRGYAELLRSGAVSSPGERTRAVSRIEAEACRMTELVDDLLLLARLDQQRPLEVSPVDLNAVVADSVADALAAEPDRPLTLTLPDQPVVVAGVDAQLRQVLANLLANIRVHTPPRTSAAVTLSEAQGLAILHVDDDGPGMSAEAAARAFDRFYRPEDSRSRATGGSGLGLAIAEAIVTAHGGSITLEAATKGTHITINLPVDGHAARV